MPKLRDALAVAFGLPRIPFDTDSMRADMIRRRGNLPEGHTEIPISPDEWDRALVKVEHPRSVYGIPARLVPQPAEGLYIGGACIEPRWLAGRRLMVEYEETPHGPVLYVRVKRRHVVTDEQISTWDGYPVPRGG